ncbi:hypothetical protein V500_00859 [Pseudogymnoascus sp. VKM F-4518 (FW-2643)]|nr:hypothetical protein V500_00859 [Pseudogymnoascus sp. VKM F-4518 (FW-2643)]
MLSEYEKLASNCQTSTQQPWTFTVKEGDVQCIAHIINIVVQAALKSLKADADTETEAYRCKQGAARIPHTRDTHVEVMNTLAKLRRHIYVFYNRRAWKDALQRQTKAAGLKLQQLSLDMPQFAQRSNLILPSRRLQSDSYPTLNFAIPLYLKMINKVKKMQHDVGEHSTIGIACAAAYLKLHEYYTLATNRQCKHLAVATICDPRMNYIARAQFEDVCRKYKTRQYHLDTERIEHETALSFALGNANNREQEPDSDEDLFASEGISFEEPEWKRWMLEPRPGEHTDIFKYWSAKQYQYPIVAQVARDHLAILATSAPSERVFSNGSDIITKKRNKLSPLTIRYLLCLRNWGQLPDADSDGDDADDEAEK